ncbi:glyoxylate/hydroxypyruvate reductase A [Terrarubrum flagellatum]|uniref:2-hydroxyacid dehydrogenase n=1 Tax=Terrirubrum flagellatum TaxID=2895980 RepID=UPI00314534BE
MADPSQAEAMVEYAMMATLWLHRRMPHYQDSQCQLIWAPQPAVRTSEHRACVLGLGEFGSRIAQRLRDFGFETHGWSRTPKILDGIACYTGRKGLASALQRCNYLICVLPLTSETAGILNAETLALLPRGACIINMGRGAHIVDADLLSALDSGHIGGAILDVFNHEPLPNDHPYWRHPKVLVTPHIAAELYPPTAAGAVAENIRRMQVGLPLQHVFDRARGY